MKLALLQTPVTECREDNLNRAYTRVAQAAAAGARLICLPEMFTCPYDNNWFRRLAEPAEGPSWQAMSQWARELGVWLVGGSIPEQEGHRLYNTAFVFDPKGQEIARHRKVHLFDIAVEGGQVFRESDTFTPGDRVTIFDAEGMRFGLCICFDFRFPELARAMTLQGAQVLLVPGAFNMTTGPAHWELLFRQRAVDNQVYTVGIAPARDPEASYVSYGNSMVCDPWGQVLIRAGEGAETLYRDLDPARVQAIRQQLPLLRARRPAVYEDGVLPGPAAPAAFRRWKTRD